MGRRSHGRSLSIWTNGVRVGRWTIPARGEVALRYDADWLAYGLPATNVHVATFGDQRVLIVEIGERRGRHEDLDGGAGAVLVAARTRRRHFNSTARNVGYASTAEPIIEALLARTPAAIAEVQAELPADFSPRVRDAILGGLQQAAKALGAMPP